jgi:hypothetical protein
MAAIATKGRTTPIEILAPKEIPPDNFPVLTDVGPEIVEDRDSD